MTTFSAKCNVSDIELFSRGIEGTLPERPLTAFRGNSAQQLS